MTGNLFHAIEAQLADSGAPFLHVPEDEIVINYGNVLELSGRYANALAALGVGRGDRVAVQTHKRKECIWLYLGCLRLGAVYLPLNTAYTPAEIDYFVRDAEPALFVCEMNNEKEMEPLMADAGVKHMASLGPNGGGSLPEMAAGCSTTFDTEEIDGDDLAAILYTSGTTGRSKGAMISHENLRSNAMALAEIWRFTADDVLLHALPIYHTHGLFVAINTVLLTGGSMIFMPKFDVDQVMTALPQATAMMGVPTFYIRLLGSPDFDADATRHMRIFISGSAPLSAEIHRSFTARTGHAILERYGMTETNMITSNPYDGERRPGAVGFALPGVSVRVADPESGQVLPDGEIGVIELKGPNVFKGYWRMPEKTSAEFRDDGYFITGDLGYFDKDGYLTISGRGKDLIISGGLNVYPAEVENQIDEQPEVAESAVIGVPHPDFGEGVTAIVVATDSKPVNEMDLRNRLAGSLAKFKVPQRIITVDALPKNAMGKIQKNMLRDTYKDLYA